jgi:hypothetical protein
MNNANDTRVLPDNEAAIPESPGTEANDDDSLTAGTEAVVADSPGTE